MCLPFCLVFVPHRMQIFLIHYTTTGETEDNNVEQAGASGGRQKLIREVFLPRLLATKVCMFAFHDIVNFIFLYQHVENFTTFR